MNRRIKKKKGLIYSEADQRLKERAFREIEQEALALERKSEGVVLPEELQTVQKFPE